jgi:hypothetical protein
MWQEAKEDVKEWDMDDKIVGAGAVVAVAGSIAPFPCSRLGLLFLFFLVPPSAFLR